VTWLNVTHAGKKEIDYLAKNFKFHPLDLKDSYASSYAQRPKIDAQPDYLFLIFLFPYYSRKKREIIAAEIDFFITPTHLAMVHNEELAPLINFFNTCKINPLEKDKYMAESPAKLLYEILNRLEMECFPMLDHISIDIKNIENKIFAGYEKQMLREILIIKRNIVNFRKTMQAHKNIIEHIIKINSPYFPQEHLRDYYRDLIDHTKNIWDILENQRQTIDAMEDTNSALVGFKTNDIIKILTIFSVIVFPLTLFASIFGMNTVNTPLIGNQFDFWIIISIMFITSITMLIFFRKKKWL
jgi:magnesium transporter